MTTQECNQKRWEIYKELFIHTMDDHARQGYRWKEVSKKDEMFTTILDCADKAVSMFDEHFKPKL